MPPIDVRFRRFTSLNTTIRLREGEIRASLSDLLEGAPEKVLRAIAHILLAKLYRQPIDAQQARAYRRFTTSEAVVRQSERIRQTRGRKRIVSAQGDRYDLDEVFESLNRRFFHGLMGRPVLTWSEYTAKRLLGHYDAAHNTIMVSRVFDRRGTPRYAIEYLMYHEMLHLKHPVKHRNGRRCVHSRAFQDEERLFPELALAKAFLKQL
ncbi:MAG TPA: M48 family peptidase [Acidobacteriaceae bacterium]|nr:M48 family peptidase [Acidobacteriaceae bacterium]